MLLAHPFSTIAAVGADGTPLVVHLTAPPPTERAPETVDARPWVLLIASPSTSLAYWRPLVEYLGGRFRFVAVGYRGVHGAGRPREAGAYTFAHHVGDLRAGLEAAGVGDFAVLGASVGALLALELARELPRRVTHLALVNPVFPAAISAALDLPVHRALVPGLLRLGRRIYPTIAPLQKRVAGAPEAAGWLKRLGLAGETLDDDLFGEIASAFESIDLDAYRGAVEALEHHDRPLELETLRVPALVIAGEDDRIGSPLAARRVARRLPFGEFFVVRGGTHYTPLEFPELVNLRVEKFLDAHPSASA